MYDNVYEHTPISQYIPLPLKEIQEGYKDQQKTYDEGMAIASSASEPIVGGNVTKAQAAALNAQKDRDIAAMVEDANKNNSYGQLPYKIKEYASKLKANPIYQGIKMDEQLSPKVDEQVMSPGSEQNIQDYFDHKTKTYNQLPTNQPFNSSVYRELNPGNTNAEYKPLFDQIKPEIISKVYAQPVYKEVKDANGTIHTQEVQEGEEAQSIRRDRVKNILSQYVLNDPSSLNKESRIYASELHKRMYPGSKYDVNDHLDDITNAFLGDFSIQKEIQNLKADGTSKAAGAGKGRGNGNSNDTPPSSEIGTALMLKEKGLPAAVRPETIAAVNNGEVSKSVPGGVIINTDNNTPLFRIAPAASYEDNLELNKYIPFKLKREEIRKNAINALDDLQGSEAATGKEINGKYYHKDASGVIHESESGYGPNNNEIRDIKTLTEDQYLQLLPEYQKLDSDAKANNTSIKDVNLDKMIGDGNSSIDDIKLILGFNIALKGLKGNKTFLPDAQDNFTTDDNGKIITNTNLHLSEDDAKDLFDKQGIIWNTNNRDKLEGLKLISHHYENKINEKTGETIGRELVYDIPVHNKTQMDVGTANKTAEIGRWGNSKETRENIDGQTQDIINSQDRFLVNKTIKRISEGKISTSDIFNIVNGIQDNLKNSGEILSPQQIKDYTYLKNKYIVDKDYKNLYLLNLKLNNPNQYQRLKDEVQSSNTLNSTNSYTSGVRDTTKTGNPIKRFDNPVDAFDDLKSEMSSKLSYNNTWVKPDIKLSDYISKFAPKDDGNDPQSYTSSMVNYFNSKGLNVNKDSTIDEIKKKLIRLKLNPSEEFAKAHLRVEDPKVVKLLKL